MAFPSCGQCHVGERSKQLPLWKEKGLLDSFENNSQLPLIRSANEQQGFATIYLLSKNHKIKASLSERTAMTMERPSARPTTFSPTINSLFRPRTNLHRPLLFRRPRPKTCPKPIDGRRPFTSPTVRCNSNTSTRRHAQRPKPPTAKAGEDRSARPQPSAMTSIKWAVIMEHLIDHLEA